MLSNDTTAHIGYSVQPFDYELTVGAVTTYLTNQCITDVFVIDGAFLENNDSAKIQAIDVIESLSAGTLSKGDYTYFISNKDFTGAAIGGTFSYSGEAADIVAIIKPTNTYDDIEALKTFAHNEINRRVKGSTTTALYCQVLSNGGATLTTGEKLVFRFYIERD